MNAGNRPVAAPRSALVVPAIAGTRLDRAPLRGADQVVIDLEDAVSESGKARAREAVVAALAGPAWDDVDVAVRVNGWESAHTCSDVVAVLTGCAGRVTTLVLPKVESALHVLALELVVTQVERSLGWTGPPVRLAALVESAAGLAAVHEIAAAEPRLSALVLGPLDLAGDLDVPSDEGTAEPLPSSWRQDALRRLVLAGRARRLSVMDGPSFAVADPTAAAHEAQRARRCGCDGSWVIHPAQVRPVHEAFTSSPAEVARALSVLAAVEGTGGAAGRSDGQMVDAASVRSARNVLARRPG